MRGKHLYRQNQPSLKNSKMSGHYDAIPRCCQLTLNCWQEKLQHYSLVFTSLFSTIITGRAKKTGGLLERKEKHSITRKVSLNWKEHGNCRSSWCTQSSHCRKTGHLSFTSSDAVPWPQRSANLCPNSSHSFSTRTRKPFHTQQHTIMYKESSICQCMPTTKF